MKKYFTFLICIFIPFNKFKILLLRLMGHDVSFSSKIGVNLIFVNKLIIKENTRIGHFNFFKIDSLTTHNNSLIKNLNFVKGPLDLVLSEYSGLGNSNKIRRSYPPIAVGKSIFLLGKNTHIASNHFFDLTNSIEFGEHSQVAGIRTQFWTHGFYHANIGGERIRIDGKIKIGNNVYIGSGCIFNPGVVVNDAIHIGGGSTISKNLTKSGMYVNQGLRFIENDINTIKRRLKKITHKDLKVEVYSKNN